MKFYKRYVPERYSDIITNKKIPHTDSGGKPCMIQSWALIELMHACLFSHYQSNKKETKIDLHSKMLQYLFGCHYHDMLTYLKDTNFFYCEDKYKVGQKARTFRLCKNTYDEKLVEILVPTPLSMNKHLNFPTPNLIPKYIQKILQEDIHKVWIDYDAAMEYAENNKTTNKSYIKNKMAIESIASNELYCHFDHYGRVHTNFTILKKEIRKSCLTINNEPLCEVDIPNSQPTFLYLLMKASGFNDWGGYDKDVLDGSLYDKVAERSGKTRKNAKPLVYKPMFGKPNGTTHNTFKALYPSVYNWMCEYKKQKGSHKELSHQLQKDESNFMFNVVIPEIKMKNPTMPLVTIHDSIVFPSSEKNMVEDIFYSRLKKITI